MNNQQDEMKETKTTPPVEIAGLFGVLLINSDKSESGHSKRWDLWAEAATYGEAEVHAGRAIGFRVVRDESP